MCIDCRQLNDKTLKDAYAPTRIYSSRIYRSHASIYAILDSLTGNQYFTVIYMRLIHRKRKGQCKNDWSLSMYIVYHRKYTIDMKYGYHRIKKERTDIIIFGQKYSRITPRSFQDVSNDLKQRLASVVIRASYSPHSSNVILVCKDDRSLRMCIDWRLVTKGRLCADAHIWYFRLTGR